MIQRCRLYEAAEQLASGRPSTSPRSRWNWATRTGALGPRFQNRGGDVACFELPAVNTRGNLGRNSLTGPGLVSADVALVKSFAAGSARSLQLRIEGFNVFNRANFAVPSGRVAFTGEDAQGNPVVAPTWGRITSTVTTARQIQLAVNFAF